METSLWTDTLSWHFRCHCTRLDSYTLANWLVFLLMSLLYFLGCFNVCLSSYSIMSNIAVERIGQQFKYLPKIFDDALVFDCMYNFGHKQHRHCKSINSDWQLALTRLGKNSVPRADPKFHSSKFITCFTNNGVQCTKFFWSKIKIWVRDQSAVLIKINLFSHPKIPNEVVEWI